MSSIFADFDKKYNAADLQADIKEASENNGFNNKEVPEGIYEVKFEKLELVLSKSSSQPMLSAWMKVLNGEYHGSMIFMNQVVTKGFQLHIANEFLRALDPGINIEFNGFVEYEKLIDTAFSEINGQFEFALQYGKTEKGYPTYLITERFGVGDAAACDYDDVPF